MSVMEKDLKDAAFSDIDRFLGQHRISKILLTISNNKKDALVNVKFDNLLVVENQK